MQYFNQKEQEGPHQIPSQLHNAAMTWNSGGLC